MDFKENHKNISLVYDLLVNMSEIESDLKFFLTQEYKKQILISKDLCNKKLDNVEEKFNSMSQKLYEVNPAWMIENKHDSNILLKEIEWFCDNFYRVFVYLGNHSRLNNYEFSNEKSLNILNQIDELKCYMKNCINEVTSDREKLERLINNMTGILPNDIRNLSEEDLNELVDKISYLVGYNLCITDSKVPQNFIEDQNILS